MFNLFKKKKEPEQKALHDFEKVAYIAFSGTNKTYKEKGNFGTIVGSLNFVVCKKCNYHDTEIIFDNIYEDLQIPPDRKNSFIQMIATKDDIMEFITFWKNGFDNPPRKLKNDDIIILNPLYFQNNYISQMIRNIQFGDFEEDSEILETESTKEALKDLKESLKKLEVVLKLQKR